MLYGKMTSQQRQSDASGNVLCVLWVCKECRRMDLVTDTFLLRCTSLQNSSRSWSGYTEITKMIQRQILKTIPGNTGQTES